MKNVAKKMGIKEKASAYFANAQKEAIENMHLPEIDITTILEGEFDYIHLFAKTQAEQTELFPKLKAHLKLDGTL